MKIVIVGAGKLGKMLTKNLAAEKHDIIVIDNDEEIVEEIVNEYDVIGYHGNGASYDVLSEASAQDADLLIAVTAQDEVNILCCLVAKKLNIKQTIARVRNPDYAKEISLLNDEVGISTIINPDLDAANEIVRVIQFPSALKVESFANNKVSLVEIRIDETSPLNGMTVRQMSEKYNESFLVCCVRRGEEVFIPKGDFIFNANDKIYLAGSARQLSSLFKKLDLYKQKLKSALLIGGSRTTFYIARELLRGGIEVKIIDNRKERCEHLSTTLKDATVVYGDGTDQNLLREEGIENVDAFVALTGMDETNIMISTYAKTLEHPKVITKVNNEHYLSMLNTVVTLDSVVTPAVISSDIVVRYVRGIESSKENECKTMYHLADNKIEALEFIAAKEHTGLLNIPLKDLLLKKDVLLACILHEGSVIIPTGKDTICENDTLIIIAPHSTIKTLEDVLE